MAKSRATTSRTGLIETTNVGGTLNALVFAHGSVWVSMFEPEAQPPRPDYGKGKVAAASLASHAFKAHDGG